MKRNTDNAQRNSPQSSVFLSVCGAKKTTSVIQFKIGDHIEKQIDVVNATIGKTRRAIGTDWLVLRAPQVTTRCQFIIELPNGLA